MTDHPTEYIFRQHFREFYRLNLLNRPEHDGLGHSHTVTKLGRGKYKIVRTTPFVAIHTARLTVNRDGSAKAVTVSRVNYRPKSQHTTYFGTDGREIHHKGHNPRAELAEYKRQRAAAKQYRHVARHQGVTRYSLRSMKRHIEKIGAPQKVTIYKYRSKLGGIDPRVSVKGDKGTIYFGGFCWGYCGEGPRGLVDLFSHLGIDRTVASRWIFNMDSNYSDQIPDGKARQIVATFEKATFTVHV